MNDDIVLAFEKTRLNNPIIYKGIKEGASNIEIIIELDKQISKMRKELLWHNSRYLEKQDE